MAKVTPATVAVLLGEFDPEKSGPQSVGAGSGVMVWVFASERRYATRSAICCMPSFLSNASIGVPGRPLTIAW